MQACVLLWINFEYFHFKQHMLAFHNVFWTAHICHITIAPWQIVDKISHRKNSNFIQFYKCFVANTFNFLNTNLDGFDLQEGDIIGITSKKIVSKGAEVDDVTMEVIENLVDEDKSVITLYYGEGVTNDDANALKDILSDKYDECDVEVYEGGQNHYFYMISVE